MPFMGVRISWLMLARNSLLARLAASAVALALRNSSSACLRSVMSSVMPDEMRGVAVLVEQFCGCARFSRSVLGVHHLFGNIEELFGAKHFTILGNEVVRLGRGKEIMVVLADHLMAFVADQLDEGIVETFETQPGRILDEQGNRDIVDQRIEQVAFARQGEIGLMPAIDFLPVAAGALQDGIKARPAAIAPGHCFRHQSRSGPRSHGYAAGKQASQPGDRIGLDDENAHTNGYPWATICHSRDYTP